MPRASRRRPTGQILQEVGPTTPWLAELHQFDPAAIITWAPGVGVIKGPQILARSGDPARFRSLAGASLLQRPGLSLTASGISGPSRAAHQIR